MVYPSTAVLIILGVIQIILSQLPFVSDKTILDVLVWLIGFFLIGMFAARRTGRVGTGTLVGLVTGLTIGLIVVLFGVIQLTKDIIPVALQVSKVGFACVVITCSLCS